MRKSALTIPLVKDHPVEDSPTMEVSRLVHGLAPDRGLSSTCSAGGVPLS